MSTPSEAFVLQVCMGTNALDASVGPGGGRPRGLNARSARRRASPVRHPFRVRGRRANDNVEIVRELDGLPEHPRLPTDDDELDLVRDEDLELLAKLHFFPGARSARQAASRSD
jgi:hypothetical protein